MGVGSDRWMGIIIRIAIWRVGRGDTEEGEERGRRRGRKGTGNQRGAEGMVAPSPHHR